MEIPGVNKKRCGISRGDKKDRGISMGSWSLVVGLGNSNVNRWVQCNFVELPGVKLCLEFPRVK